MTLPVIMEPASQIFGRCLIRLFDCSSSVILQEIGASAEATVKARNWGVEVDISPACGRLQVKLPGGVMMSAYRNFVSQAGMLFAWYVC